MGTGSPILDINAELIALRRLRDAVLPLLEQKTMEQINDCPLLTELHEAHCDTLFWHYPYQPRCYDARNAGRNF